MNAADATANAIGGSGSRLDLYAATLSALCLIHCLALPLLASLLPLAGQLSENELIHRVLALLAAPATLWIGWKSRLNRALRPFIVAALPGLGLLLAGAFVHALEAHEQAVTVAGAVLLATAHLWRWMRLRGTVHPTSEPRAENDLSQR